MIWSGHNRKLVASALAILLFATGCGDDDSDDDAMDEGNQAAEPKDMTPSGAKVFFLTPSDGATVSSPVQFTMGTENFTIEPSGPVNMGAGHFHLLVDTGCVTPGETIPSNPGHHHYGGGQQEAELELSAGEHTVCLQAGDGVHTALDLTEEIRLIVK